MYPKEQVTLVHNIVADGWVGAANPNPHPTPNPIPLQHKKLLNRSISHFLTRAQWTNGPTDQRINGQTEKASYSVACPQLKRHFAHIFILFTLVFSQVYDKKVLQGGIGFAQFFTFYLGVSLETEEDDDFIKAVKDQWCLLGC